MNIRIRLSVCFLITFVFFARNLQAQQLRISAVTSPICVNQPFTIYYSTTQAGKLSVHIYGTGTDYKLQETYTNVGDNLTVTDTVFTNLPNDQYRVGLVVVTANGTVYNSSGTASIVINQAPSAPTVTTPVTYCQGDKPVALKATASGSNYKLRWYGTRYGTSPSGGTYVTDPPTPATDPPGSTTYYVSQARTDSNQCESARASILVTVNPKPTAPATTNVTVCQNAPPVSLATGVTASGTLRWYTSQTGGTPSGEPQLSTSNAGYSSVYYVSQTDPTTGCESDRSPIQLLVKAQPSQPTVSSTPIYYCQYDQAQPLSATVTTGVRLTFYDALTGGNVVTTPSTSLATNNQGTYYYVSQTTADGCEGARATIAVVVNRKPPAPTIVSSSTYCQGPTSITLAASGTNLKWYDANGAAVTGAPVISAAVATSFTYYVSQTEITSNTSCESDRATIPIQIKAKPNPPGVAPISFCANQVTPLTATFDGGSTPKWYGINAMGGTASPTAPTPSTAVIGTPVLYYVSQMDMTTGCESERASIAVTIKGLPDAPSVTSVQGPYCQGIQASPLTATVTNGVSLRWYTVATGGTASLTAITPSTSLSATVQPVSYYVSQVNADNCEGPRATISVQVNAKPAKPTGTTPATVCQNAPAVTFSANGSNLKWYADTTTTNLSTPPVITTNVPTTFTYYVSQTDVNTGCESYKASVTSTVTAAPALPSTAPITFCLNTTQPTVLTATASAGGTLNWYYGLTGGTASPTLSASASVAKMTTYYVSQTINGCESNRASVNVTINPLPAQPLVSATAAPFCQGIAATPLSATVTTVGNTLKWYLSQTDATPYPSLAPPTTNTGPGNYYVSQTDVNTGCESARAMVSFYVQSRTAPPSVNSNAFTVCQNTAPVALTASNVGTLNWYTVPADGTSTPSAVQPTTSPGVFTYYVSQTYNGCESARIPIVVTVQATPQVPTVGANPVYCQGSTASIPALSASAPNGGILLWYALQTGGTGSVTPPTPPVSSATTFTAYVSQSVNGCESARVSLVATIKAPPDVPTIVPQVTTCQNGTAVLTATLKGGVSLNWYTVIGGSASSVAPVPDTKTPGSFPYYVSQVDANGCESSKAIITVRVNALPPAPAVLPASFCQNATQAILPVIASVGTLNYYTVSMGGAASPVAPTINTASATTTPYYVSQTDVNTGCESTRSILLVTITPLPAAPAVPTIAPACQGGPAIVLTASGTNLKWYNDNVSSATVPAVQQTTLAGSFPFFVSQTVNNCESPRTPVTVTVNPSPVVPVVSASQSGCQDAVAQPLSAIGTGLQWYDANDNLISPPTPNTKVDVVQLTTYKVTQTVNGCTSAKALIQYTVNVTPPPTVNSVYPLCQSSPPTQLSVTSSIGTLRWYDPTGAVSTVAPTLQPATLSTGVSYSVSQISSLGCESRKAVINVTLTTLPTAKLENSAGTAPIYLGGSVTLNLTLTGAGPYSYTLSDGTTGVVASAVGSATTVQPISVTPASANAITYAVTRIANACGNGTIIPAAAVVDVRSQTITAGLPSPLTVCVGQPISIPFTTVGDFVTGNEFTVELGSAAEDPSSRRYFSIPAATSRNLAIVTVPPVVNAGQYVVRISASNGRFPVVGTPSSATLSIRALPAVTISASQTIYSGQSTTLNFSFTGDPSWTVYYLVGTDPTPKSFTTNLNPYPLPIMPKDTVVYRVTRIGNDACGFLTPTVPTSLTIIAQKVLAVDDLLSRSVTVYPIPTDGAVTVAIDQSLQKDLVLLRLIGADGLIRQELTTKKLQTVLSLDKEPAGTYLLQITVGDRSTVRRIIKR